MWQKYNWQDTNDSQSNIQKSIMDGSDTEYICMLLNLNRPSYKYKQITEYYLWYSIW